MKIYFDIDENNRVIGYGSTPITTNCVEMDIVEDHDVFSNPYAYTIDIEKNLIYDNQAVLEECIRQKDFELNTACNKAIMGKFPVVIDEITYYFSNDIEAQMNFDKMLRAFEKGKVEQLPWTVYRENGEVERIILDPIIFEVIYEAHLMHIQGNISRYRDVLMPMVKNSTTVEGVDEIHWDMEI